MNYRNSEPELFHQHIEHCQHSPAVGLIIMPAAEAGYGGMAVVADGGSGGDVALSLLRSNDRGNVGGTS